MKGMDWMSCNTCKYKVPGEIPGEGDMICNNRESVRFEETVNPEDCCGGSCDRGGADDG